MTTVSDPVVKKTVGLFDGWLIPATLIYRPVEPYEITIRLTQQSASVDWAFSLELLNASLNSDKLLGPGHISARRYGDKMVLVFDTTKGRKMLLVPARDVAKFLLAVKPPASLDFDEELDKLMKGE